MHEECREDFTEQLMEQQAEKCVDCGKGIRPGGKFSGAYYGESVTLFPSLHKWALIFRFTVIGRGHKIHVECRWD